MQGGGVEKAGRPVVFQKRDDIANQLRFGKCLGFAQAKQFLNPRQWLKMCAGGTRNRHFLSIGKAGLNPDLASSAMRQRFETARCSQGGNPSSLVETKALTKRMLLLFCSFQ